MSTLTFDERISRAVVETPMNLALLHKAVDNVNTDNTHHPARFSDGIRWIENNTLAFLKLLDAEGVSADEFFYPHIRYNYFMRRVLCSRQLLLAVPADRRTRFVCHIFLMCEAVDIALLAPSIACGVTPAEMGEMILAKLQETPFDDFLLNNGWMYNFLLYGAGPVLCNSSGWLHFDSTRLTYWSLLSDDQLKQVIDKLVAGRPDLLFGVVDPDSGVALADRLEVRFGATRTASILEKAASRLKKLSKQARVDVFTRLPTGVQVETACRLAKADQTIPYIWIAKMALAMEHRKRDLSLLDELLKGSQCHVSDYLQWCELLDSQPTQDTYLLDYIDQFMRAGLQANGWAVAQLNERVRFSRRQLYVEVDGAVYLFKPEQTVYQYAGKTYTPCPGDRVAFRPQDAEWLHPSGSICRVGFTLVQPTLER